MHRPMAITAGTGADENMYVTEAGPPPVQEGVPGLGNRVVVLDPDFNEVVAFGSPVRGEGPDQFIAPHGIAVDSLGRRVRRRSFLHRLQLQAGPRPARS